MMAVLKSSSFRLYISFSLGLFSVYLLLSFCSGDLMYFFILLDVVDLCLRMEIEFSCSFHLFQLLRWGSSCLYCTNQEPCPQLDRKSTRLNSSHANISYAVFCL